MDCRQTFRSKIRERLPVIREESRIVFFPSALEACQSQSMISHLLARIKQISAYRAHRSLFGGSRTRAGRKAEVHYGAEDSHENPFRYSRSRHCDFLLVIS